MSGVATVTLEYSLHAATVASPSTDSARVDYAAGGSVATARCDDDVISEFSVKTFDGDAAVETVMQGIFSAKVPSTASVSFSPPVISAPGGAALSANSYFPSGW